MQKLMRWVTDLIALFLTAVFIDTDRAIDTDPAIDTARIIMESRKVVRPFTDQGKRHKQAVWG